MQLKPPEIAILDAGYDSYDFEKELFEKNGYRLSIYNGHRDDNKAKIEFAKNAHGLLIRHTEIDRSFLQQVPKVRAIVRYGIGYDNIDLKEASKFKIKVANVQGYANHSVSDHALALLFSCIRALPLGITTIRDHHGAPPITDVFELNNKTLGVIGLGRIGTQFAIKSRALFKTVLACDPYITHEKFMSVNVVKSGFQDLIKNSDVISIHCNLTDETRELIDSDAFEKMKRNVVLINTARGHILNESDLLIALNTGIIHSAGIDVWWDEPVTKTQEPLLSHPKVIGTGHYAWYSKSASLVLQKKAAHNLIGLLKGKEIDDCLN